MISGVATLAEDDARCLGLPAARPGRGARGYWLARDYRPCLRDGVVRCPHHVKLLAGEAMVVGLPARLRAAGTDLQA